VVLQNLSLSQKIINHRIVSSRVFVSALIILLLFVILIARQYYLQVTQYQTYAALAQSNRIALRAVAPMRGIITDRNGEVLALNRPSFNLTLVREHAGDWRQVIGNVISLLELDASEQQKLEQLVLAKKKFMAVPLLFELSEEQVAKIMVNQHRLPGVAIDTTLTRHYPFKELFTHAIGYVGRINEEEAKELDKNYLASTHIGKIGVEKFYQNKLHGKVGFEEVEVNSRGKVIRVLRRDDPTAGQNIMLSIDLKLQQVTAGILAGRRAAAIVQDVNTGEILAFVSTPSFDPNPFVMGIGHNAYNDLLNSSDKPLFNRVLRGLYPPGSTIKPFVALAGLDSGVVTAKSVVFDPGFYQLKGNSHQYRNWNKNGDGIVNLRLALARSNDTYFYDLSYKLGIDRMHDYLGKFGFGSKVSYDMTEELEGVFPSTNWKRKKMNQAWYPGETLIAGIGQGYVSSTVLQLVNATALIANKGKWFAPHLAKKIGNKSLSTRVTKKDIKLKADNTWEQIQLGMLEVVHGVRGTAKRIGYDAPYKIAGKTGTAQVIGIKQGETYNRDKVPERFRDHALFIAFAPFDKPQIAVAVIVENGEGGSSTAAPIARKIMDAWLLDANGNIK